MSFQKEIEALHPTANEIAHRRWIYVPYDRFTDRVGPVSEQSAHETGIVIVESTAKALRRPYHKKKLVVLISNMRHFALEQQARGVSVLYHFSPTSHGQALLDLQRRQIALNTTCHRIQLCIGDDSSVAAQRDTFRPSGGSFIEQGIECRDHHSHSPIFDAMALRNTSLEPEKKLAAILSAISPDAGQLSCNPRPP